MPRLRTDVVVNTLGQGWAVAISLLFVPFFVNRLGIEGYAVIALLPLATALIQVLDGGLALTLNREMARTAASGAPDQARSTAWTLQIVHLSAGVVVGLSTLALLPAAGMAWLQPKDMAAADLHVNLLLIAAAVALQWPIPLFQNGLMGLGKQAQVNGLLAVNSTVLNVGAAAWITFGSQTVSSYLMWAGACALLHSIALAIVFWRALPLASAPVCFELGRLRALWRFSGGAAGIGVTGVILMHVDRIVASRLLSLEQFGYYGLATTIGRSVYLLIAPVFSAVFPRLSALVARKDIAGLTALYSAGTQFMAVAIFPLTAIVFWMGFDLAFAWLGNAETARSITHAAALLALGAALNGVMNLPYALQLAWGLVRLGVGLNVMLIAVAVPAAFVLCLEFGPAGAAASWLLTMVIYFAAGVPLTHHMTRVGRPITWMLRDVLPPAAVSFASVGVVHAAVGSLSSRLDSAIALILAACIAYGLALLSAPILRREARALLRRLVSASFQNRNRF